MVSVKLFNPGPFILKKKVVENDEGSLLE